MSAPNAIRKRIERQRRLVATLEGRLRFERLVLRRLEGRLESPEPSEPSDDPPASAPGEATIGAVYRAALARAAG